MTPKQFAVFQEQMESIKAKRDKAVGAKEQLMEQLGEHGCSSVKEAKELITNLEEERKEVDQKAEELEKEFTPYLSLLEEEE